MSERRSSQGLSFFPFCQVKQDYPKYRRTFRWTFRRMHFHAGNFSCARHVARYRGTANGPPPSFKGVLCVVSGASAGALTSDSSFSQTRNKAWKECGVEEWTSNSRGCLVPVIPSSYHTRSSRSVRRLLFTDDDFSFLRNYKI